MSGWSRSGESRSSARPTSRCPLSTRWSASRFRPVLVVSQPPRPAGRGRARRTPRSRCAPARSGIEVWQPQKVRDPEFLESFARARRRRRGGGGVRPDLPAGAARAAAARLHQPARARCCRVTAARRRSRPRSRPATPRPASPPCGWRRGSTPGRSCSRRTTPIGDDEDAPALAARLARDRRRADDRDARAARERHAGRAAAGRRAAPPSRRDSTSATVGSTGRSTPPTLWRRCAPSRRGRVWPRCCAGEPLKLHRGAAARRATPRASARREPSSGCAAARSRWRPAGARRSVSCACSAPAGASSTPPSSCAASGSRSGAVEFAAGPGGG